MRLSVETPRWGREDSGGSNAGYRNRKGKLNTGRSSRAWLGSKGGEELHSTVDPPRPQNNQETESIGLERSRPQLNSAVTVIPSLLAGLQNRNLFGVTCFLHSPPPCERGVIDEDLSQLGHTEGIDHAPLSAPADEEGAAARRGRFPRLGSHHCNFLAVPGVPNDHHCRASGCGNRE